MLLNRLTVTSPIRQTGFTLVEMTVVLLLITLLASVAVRETAELGFQTRYEQTKERLEMIRQAILGNPKQVINGQQAVSGFVADMGRLPDNLRELLQMGFCVTSGAATPPLPAQIISAARNPNACTETNEWRWTSAPCTDGVSTVASVCVIGSHVWLSRQSDTLLNTGLNFGWNGAYLSVSGNPSDSDALTDGWGRLAQGYCSRIDYTDQGSCETNGFIWTNIDNNYGWYFDSWSFSSPIGQLIIQSYGKDHLFAGFDYDTDYPAPASQPAVKSQDWLVDISGGISINLLKKFGSDKFCGFSGPGTNYTSEQSCKNAGGSWSGSCTFDISSCKSVGGKWKSCFLTSASCANAGGVSSLQCQFTEKSCNAAGSSWNSTTKLCPLSSSIATKADCALIGGAWVQSCAFDNAACSATPTDGTHSVGTWESTAPASCSFATQSDCYNIGGRTSNIISGQSTGDECYMSHAEYTGNQYAPETCRTASGNWTGRVCLNVFYRRNGAVVHSSSLPTNIAEDGSYQTVQFNFQNYNNQTDCDSNNGTWDSTSSQCFYNVPIGQNAIGVYEYTDNDGDDVYCEPGSDKFYPVDRPSPIQVDFRPNTTLPVINW